MAPNKTFVFKKIPTAFPVVGEHIVTETREIDLDDVPKGGLIVENLYASFDPYLRGKMRDPKIPSYSPAFEADSPIANAVLGKVLKSDNADYKEGDLVKSQIGIAQYSRIEDPSKVMTIKINNPHNLDLPLFLGPLGMPGLTAWSGLYEIGKPKKGETIFISSAAGAVGQLVGQIAKHEGLTVIGSVGSDEKLDFILNDLGFDKGFNYKKESPSDALDRLAPNGIDIYFENVGGDHLEAALTHLNVDGRIPVCGMISNYNVPRDQQVGIKNIGQLIPKRITMQGFLVMTPKFGPKYYQEHQEKLQGWLASGDFKSKLFTTEGIDNAGEGFVGMLEGKNFGKAVLKI